MLERNDALYSNTPETDFYLDSAKSSYIGGYIELETIREYSMFASLKEAVTTGHRKTRSKAAMKTGSMWSTRPRSACVRSCAR
jgi:hypothetical protein